MEFNWADPRKNKRVDTVMMAKAEASRVKRLTSVKSTVSNQLNPAVEHKLKTLKKKKAPESQDERPSSRLHQREFDLGNNSSSSSNHTGGSSQGLRATGSSSNNHSFYNEFLPQAARPKSIFDSFDVHAAADGLFHPASNVQAFAEHDARYPAARDKDSGRSTASSKGGEKRLPPLSGSSDRSERLASRSESRLPTACSSVSSSAASSYRGLSGLGGNRSDGDLHAPRRVGIVPSSADCNAMELLEELENDGNDDEDGYEEETEPQDPSPVPVKSHKHKKAATKRESDNNNDGEHHDLPPLELDLVQKFAKLKTLIKTNREKGTHGDDSQATRGPEVEEEGDAQHVAVAEKKAVTRKEFKTSKPVKDKGVTKKQPTTEESTSRSTSSQSEAPVVVRKPKTKTSATSELKVRNGVSLSDLKEEHRAALAMLQELGGPLDEHADASKQKASRHARVTASSKEKKVVSKSSVADPRPSGSADRSSRLVEKLRARIPSAGRDKPTPTDTEDSLQGPALVAAALDAARVALVNGEEMLARRELEEELSATAASHTDQQDADANEQLWKRYGGDEQDEGEDEDDDPSAELYDDEGFEG